MNFVDISYYYNGQINDPDALLQSHFPSLGYLDFLPGDTNCSVVKFMNYKGERTFKGVRYYFFKGRSHFAFIPFVINWWLRSKRPDVVLFQGLAFPIQLIFLRWSLGRNTAIIVQHHGEQPFTGLKRILQKVADKYINAYIFTSLGNANVWAQKNIIISLKKCYEIQEASSFFVKQDKQQSKLKTGLTGTWNFIWVGRLNSNKNPVMVLRGFEKYLAINPEAKMHMIYQADDLLVQVKEIIDNSELLKQAVFLKGKVPNDELSSWYNAVDFYISGSHREGSGYALIEAMACGCIPVITKIPTFRKMTCNGAYGILYEPSDVDSLFESLKALHQLKREELSSAVSDHFMRDLSFKAIADKLYELCRALTGK